MSEEKISMKECVMCGATLNDDDVFCGKCGTPQIKIKTCSQCNFPLGNDFSFCPNCGQKIEKLTKSELNKLKKILHQSYIDGMTSILKKIMDVRQVSLEYIGNEPLIISACQDLNIDIVEALLNAGANVNAHSRFNYQSTPVRIARDAKNDKLVKMLVKHGADINYPQSLSGVPPSCYITTATCESYGKPDNCYELTTFRKFRDSWLCCQDDGPQLIQQYYKKAPDIVVKINSMSNRNEIYKEIYEKYLRPCLTFIENGENEKCKEHYTLMVNTMEKLIIK